MRKVVPPCPTDFVTTACTRCHHDTVWADFSFRRSRRTPPESPSYYRSGVCQACHIADTQVRIARAQIRHVDGIKLEQALNMLDFATERVRDRVKV